MRITVGDLTIYVEGDNFDLEQDDDEINLSRPQGQALREMLSTWLKRGIRSSHTVSDLSIEIDAAFCELTQGAERTTEDTIVLDKAQAEELLDALDMWLGANA